MQSDLVQFLRSSNYFGINFLIHNRLFLSKKYHPDDEEYSTHQIHSHRVSEWVLSLIRLELCTFNREHLMSVCYFLRYLMYGVILSLTGASV